MTIYYADTSAIIKRYISEQGSRWVQSISNSASGNIIVICELTPVEIFSALERKKQSSPPTVTAADALTFQADFLTDADREYLIVEVNKRVFTSARNLVTRYRRLRALDAVQLASAVEFLNLFGEPTTFISADNDLLVAAAGEGFAIDNPLNYP